jgi:GT2 family glycosyltransferase
MELTPRVLESCVKLCANEFDAIIIPEISHGGNFWDKVHAFEKSLYIGDDLVESARFFKTNIYWKVGGHNTLMVLSEDKDIDLRIREAGYQVGRTPETLYHNEKNLSLFKLLRKKFFYGKTSAVFIKAHPLYSLKQANLIFRPAYFRHWKKFISNPSLSLAFILLKVLETTSVFLGFISAKVPFITVDPWKK